MSVITNEQPLAIRVPYATVNYEMIGASILNIKMPIINFAVENSVNMDEAIRAVEVLMQKYLPNLTCVILIVILYSRFL